jgi:hypothetical protein
MIKKHDGFSIYDKNFYKKNYATEYAAKTIIDHLFSIFPHESVVDVGCGRAAWLMAAKSNGATTLFGVDGPWNSKNDMPSDDINFVAVNLEEDFRTEIPRKFDFCISLEVAEHLPCECAENFVKSLCDTSDIILFSAAFFGQGGTGHVNENRHSFWADIFARQDYIVFDAIRPVFWGRESIDFWYQQNVFLYIKRNTNAFEIAKKNYLSELTNLAFMDAVHPDLYKIKCEHRLSTRDLLKALPRALSNTFMNRVQRLRLYLFGQI